VGGVAVVSAPMGDWGPWIGIDPATGNRTVREQVGWYRAGDSERAVVFLPGYSTDRKSYGRHGMDIKWLLRGPKGVTQFLVYSGWVPGTDLYGDVHAPTGADLGYHSTVQQYEHQEPMTECDYLGGRTCYYDGSGLQADALLRRFLVEGEQVIWRTLTERHDDLGTEGTS
jgi:hypothetical protein